MIIRNIILVPFLFTVLLANGQHELRDSLLKRATEHSRDTLGVNALLHLADMQIQPDSVINYVAQAQRLVEKLDYKKGEADCLLILSKLGGLSIIYGQSIQYALNALSIYTDIEYSRGMATAHGRLQAIYRALGEYTNSLHHAFAALNISQTDRTVEEFMYPGHASLPLILAEIGQTYVLMNNLDSASYFTQKSIDKKELFNNSEWNFPVYLFATIQNMKGHYIPALENYRRALPLAVQNGFYHDTLQIFSGMSTLFKNMKTTDSAIHYAQIVVDSRNPELETKNLLEAITNLADLYKIKGNKDSALKYVEISYSLKDSIFSREKDREIQNIAFSEKLKQQELVSDQLKYKNKVQLYTLVFGIIVLLLIAGILWRNNRSKQKAKTRIEKAYTELKVTQQQLIQSEKMASLGELTAGIAHEIQNPLNFVNNFSEVSNEMIDEMKEQLAVIATASEAGSRKQDNVQLAMGLADDVKQNLEKINLHGKRADAIVKGMLQHARTTGGQKEPTDINALAEEYIRLAYHGMRTKGNSFNAIPIAIGIETDFDNTIGKINIVPQEIGRVMLNLLNNAFYAVNEKAKLRGASYEPRVVVSTKKNGDMVEIVVEDNGNGIPQKILDKIFQPFFTTKPAGQGTGLGLSLAYDVVKAHGGEIKVNTREGEFTEIVVQLPVIHK